MVDSYWENLDFLLPSVPIVTDRDSVGVNHFESVSFPCQLQD